MSINMAPFTLDKESGIKEKEDHDEEVVLEGSREVVEEEEEEEEEEKKNINKVPFLKLFQFADSSDYILMAIGTIGAMLHGASLPVFSIFFGKLVNVIGVANVSSPSVTHEVAKYALVFVYLSVVMLFSSWIEVSCWMYTGERQTAKMRQLYFSSVLNQDISLFDVESSSGNIIVVITSDVIVIQEAISEKVGNFIHYACRFITGFTLGFIQIWEISLVTLSILPLIAIAGGFHVYVATGLIARVRKSYLKAGEIAEEVIENVRTTQAYVGEEKAVKSYTRTLRNVYKYGKNEGLAKGLGVGVIYFVLFISWAMLLWFTSIIVHKRIANGGEAFAAMANVVYSSVSIGLLVPNMSTFIRARVAAYPIFYMIENTTTHNKLNSRNGYTLEAVQGHIQFNDVCFSYPSRPNVIIFDHLNLDIPSGKVVALVGSNGSGKSTVISLIERFYEPLSGNILLDGNDMKGLDLKWLRKQIGLVCQEPALFATTIRENILYGNADATLEEIMLAAKLSEVASFINKFPNKYETQVGERGAQLSGGQKQRIAIARAILKNSPILLLDEATSALDAKSEKSIQETLDQIMVGRTTVVVAHHLSTIKNADVIVVFDGERIIETGSHDELLSNPNGAYSALLLMHGAAATTDQQPIGASSIRHSSRDLSHRTTSLGSSFGSERNSMADETETKELKCISIRRLYEIAAPDYVYGVFGVLGAIATGSQTPLFALGITTALVAYYKDWETTQIEIRRLALLFCGGAILNVVFHTVEHLSFGILGERLTLRVREMMFSAILRKEIGWFDNTSNSSSILSSRLEADATLLKILIVDRLAMVVQNMSLIITAFIIAFIVNWRITLVILATFPLLIAGNISEKLFIKGYGGNLSKTYLKANMVAGEAVSNIRTVAAFCAEDKVLTLYSHQLIDPGKQAFRRGQIAGIFYGIAQFFIFSSYGLALWYGSILLGKGQATFSSILKPFFVLIVCTIVMGDTLSMAPDLIKGNQMVASLFEIIDGKTEVESEIGEVVSSVEGRIEFKGINFSYPSRPDVLIFNGFDLKVYEGQCVALIGSNGSGKSSVLALILRYYDPTAGKVTVDGKDIKKLNLKSLRRHIGLVQQEPILFATTIYENILYGKDGASESEVIEAAKLANAHTFISSLSEGYSTKVGKRGAQLSGGQKQRIAIARAILKNASILLLDEATSALDVESEYVVQEALDGLMKHRTTVMVAHRLSTIKNANQICVLQEGKIIEKGSHSSLIKDENGAYSQLINIQQQQL